MNSPVLATKVDRLGFTHVTASKPHYCPGYHPIEGTERSAWCDQGKGVQK